MPRNEKRERERARERDKWNFILDLSSSHHRSISSSHHARTQFVAKAALHCQDCGATMKTLIFRRLSTEWCKVLLNFSASANSVYVNFVETIRNSPEFVCVDNKQFSAVAMTTKTKRKKEEKRKNFLRKMYLMAQKNCFDDFVTLHFRSSRTNKSILRWMQWEYLHVSAVCTLYNH